MITTMVCFRCADTDYCIPVDATRAVRQAAGIIPMPSPRPDIAGIIAGQPPLPVVSALGVGGGHILVLEAAGKTFGLLVDVVTGLRRVPRSQINPPPDGQDNTLISGTVDEQGHLILLVDPAALEGRL